MNGTPAGKGSAAFTGGSFDPNDPGILRKMVEALTSLPHDTYQSGNMNIGPEQALPYAGQFVAPGMVGAEAGGLGIFGGRIGAKRLGRELTSVGKDTKPRFEIDDSKSQLKTVGDFGLMRLGEFFDHPDLYQAYPDLKNAYIKNSGTTGGWYDHKNNLIGIPAGAGNQKSVLLHELQHAVQAREGFDLGSNPVVYSKELPDRALAASHQVRAKLNELQDKAVKYLKRKGNPAGEIRETPYAEEYKRLLDYNKKLSDIYERQSPQNKYLRNAGETEARNVQYRKDMTAEQRRQLPPEDTEGVPRSKQTLGDLLIKAMGNRS